MKVQGNGPIPTRVMLVGEAPGAEEEALGQPFVGSSGQELNRMLHEAGIMRSECYVTNVVKYRPPNNDLSNWIPKAKKDVTSAHVRLRDKYVLPVVMEGYDELIAELKMVQPNLIITFGNYSMWALTGAWGILKWRGSQLKAMSGFNIPEFAHLPLPKLIPTIHPAAILREWSNRALVVADLRRAKREMVSREYSPPKWQFHVRPSFTDVSLFLYSLLNGLEAPATNWDYFIDVDIETRNNYMACLGLSFSRLEGVCIPFMCTENKEGYWSLEEEAWIIWMCYKILTHPKVKIRWQNGLFDAQFIHKYWHFIPRHAQDTMISQHSLFCALPKGLSFLASMYAEHYVYWKDEGKTWDKNTGEEQLWAYNLQDCVYTREVGEVLQQSIEKMGVAEVDKFQQSMFHPVLAAMLRGVRVKEDRARTMALDIQEEISAREAFLYGVLGHPINISSPLQMQKLFYEDLNQKPIMKRKLIQGRMLMRPTTDDEALTQIGTREPLLKPICNAIADLRTLGKFLGDFVMMKRDDDGRMRCSFNIAGDAGGKSAPYSYRLSSGKNPFGGGGNLQTIPSDKSKSAGKAKARGSIDFALPNIREMYGPDEGMTFFDLDLDRADLQVVVWESNDEALKAALHLGADIHLFNSFILDGKEPPPLEELAATHPKYADHLRPQKHKREFAKVFCHATNYVGSARTISAHTGRTVAEVDRAQRIWFGAHPGIKLWHDRIQGQINAKRYVENKFGYRWYIFDRLDNLLPEAVAWIPQSTVGCVINRIWGRFYDELPEVQVLLQVHDSLAGQFPTHRKDYVVPKMKELAKIVIPYDDPLIIPVGLKFSDVSWGDCS